MALYIQRQPLRYGNHSLDTCLAKGSSVEDFNDCLYLTIPTHACWIKIHGCIYSDSNRSLVIQSADVFTIKVTSLVIQSHQTSLHRCIYSKSNSSLVIQSDQTLLHRCIDSKQLSSHPLTSNPAAQMCKDCRRGDIMLLTSLKVRSSDPTGSTNGKFCQHGSKAELLL